MLVWIFAAGISYAAGFTFTQIVSNTEPSVGTSYWIRWLLADSISNEDFTLGVFFKHASTYYNLVGKSTGFLISDATQEEYGKRIHAYHDTAQLHHNFTLVLNNLTLTDSMNVSSVLKYKSEQGVTISKYLSTQLVVVVEVTPAKTTAYFTSAFQSSSINPSSSQIERTSMRTSVKTTASFTKTVKSSTISPSSSQIIALTSVLITPSSTPHGAIDKDHTMIIGVSVGTIAVLIILVLVLCYYIFHMRNPTNSESESHENKNEGTRQSVNHEYVIPRIESNYEKINPLRRQYENTSFAYDEPDYEQLPGRLEFGGPYESYNDYAVPSDFMDELKIRTKSL